MKEIVILSGKGGTGKTSVTASFAALAKNAVVVDCDVDAADMHLVLAPDVREENDFTGGKQAQIIAQQCISCGRCAELCRFGAITKKVDGKYEVDALACEGCGVCARFCPENAIEFEQTINGRWFVSDTRAGVMVHAKLGVAAENSGKLVTLIKNRAREIARETDAGFLLVDGPPGIGCPVIASMSGADIAVIVTEPSVSGLHDLERVLKLAQHFKTASAVIINKYDINEAKSAEVETAAAKLGAPVVARLPYDPAVTRAQIKGVSVVEYDNGPISEAIKSAWNAVSRRRDI